MVFVKPASHRLRGMGLTNTIDTSVYRVSRIKLVSGIRNTGFQFAGIAVSSGKNIQVDISKVAAEVNKGKKEIIVHIPKAEILSHEIEDDSIETLDEKDGLFNKIKVEDIREFDTNSKAAMEQRAIENGLLDKAFENAKAIIYKLLDTDIVEELEYTITFETIEE